MDATFPRKVDLKLVLSIIATGLLSFTGVVVETAMNVTFPTLIQEFSIDTTTVQWVTTGYLLILAMMIPTSSFLKQSYPMKGLFSAACVLFIVGTVMGGFAGNFWILLLGRILEGAGTGIALPLMFNIVMEQAPLDKMGLMMGAAMLVCALAPAVGPSLGGYIVHAFGWHMIFLSLLPLLLISLLCGVYAIRQSSPYGPTTFDFFGWVMVGCAFTFLILGCGQLDKLAEAPLNVIGFFVASGLLLTAFYRHAQQQLAKHKKPLLNMAVFHARPFVFSALGMLMMQFACLGIGFLLPNYSQIVAGENAFTAGCILLPGCLVGAALAPLSGRLYDRLGARIPLFAGTLCILISQIGFSLNLAASTTLTLTLIYIIFTIGQGFVAGNILTYGMSRLPEDLRSDGNAVFNTAQQLAGAIGTSIAAAIVASAQEGSEGFTAGTLTGTQQTFYLLILLALLQGVFVWLALRGYQQT